MVNMAKGLKFPESSQSQTGCHAPHPFHTLSFPLDSVEKEKSISNTRTNHQKNHLKPRLNSSYQSYGIDSVKPADGFLQLLRRQSTQEFAEGPDVTHDHVYIHPGLQMQTEESGKQAERPHKHGPHTPPPVVSCSLLRYRPSTSSAPSSPFCSCSASPADST